MALVVDTGVLLAALHAEDPDHELCRALLDETTEPRIIPCAVFGELDYWLRKQASAHTFLAFCNDVRNGAYRIHPLDDELLMRAAELEVEYEDLRLGFVDATLLATCEAFAEKKVATFDRRHFSVLRTKDGDALRLLPDSR